MSKISPCLWFDGDAEEAANFYVSLLPNSRIDHVQRSPVDYPGGNKGGRAPGRLHACRPVLSGAERRHEDRA